jgi:hypothetical protein
LIATSAYNGVVFFGDQVTKVDDLDCGTVFGDHDVLGLDVTVDDAVELKEASDANHAPEDIGEEFETTFKATLFRELVDVRVEAFHVDLALIASEFPALYLWNTGMGEGFEDTEFANLLVVVAKFDGFVNGGGIHRVNLTLTTRVKFLHATLITRHKD